MHVAGLGAGEEPGSGARGAVVPEGYTNPTADGRIRGLDVSTVGGVRVSLHGTEVSRPARELAVVPVVRVAGRADRVGVAVGHALVHGGGESAHHYLGTAVRQGAEVGAVQVDGVTVGGGAVQ